MGQRDRGLEEIIALIEALGVPRSVAGGIEQILGHYALGVGSQQRPFEQPNKVQHQPSQVPRNIAALAEIFHRRALKRVDLLGELAGDYAWQMLLALTAEEGKGRTLSVSALCLAGGARPTTGLRLIDSMEEEGLIRRVADPKDGRRSLVYMTEETRDRMHKMLLEFCVSPPLEPPPLLPRVFAN